MKLHNQVQTLRAASEHARNLIAGFSVYLASSKFGWPEDWIRTWEVKNRLEEIERVLYDASQDSLQTDNHQNRKD